MRTGDEYVPMDNEDIGWLGYYIGNNTQLQELRFYTAIDNVANESFYKEMSRNKSIQEISFWKISLNGKLLRMLTPFFKNNCNLVEVTFYECDIEGDMLSVAIGNCNKSMRRIEMFNNGIRDGQLVDTITALRMHPQLEVLDLHSMTIGRNECTVLSSLLSCSATQLKILNLQDNNIDDEGVEYLVNALTNVKTLQKLDLCSNRSITIKGWKKVSTLLEGPDSKLKMLRMLRTYGNSIENDGALVFAEALTNNSTLKTFNIEHGNSITDWAPFSKLLCDTSSPNKTYLSNHTLHDIGNIHLPNDIKINLKLNTSANKDWVAMAKILRNHPHFDMEPFFEWEFKVVPIMINWFTKASTYTNDASSERLIKRIKLDSMYAFIREFPMLYIEPKTRQELAEYNAMEMLLRGSEMQHTSILEEIHRCKTNALRRL